MNIPRAHSDPGVARLDPIWRQHAPPCPPVKAYVQPIPQLHNSRHHGAVRASMLGSTRSIGVNAPSINLSSSAPEAEYEPKRKRRNWFTRIVMAPCDLLEWALKRWCAPSENCINCVKVTYWIVLIVAGIIGTVITIAPFT